MKFPFAGKDLFLRKNTSNLESTEGQQLYNDDLTLDFIT